MNIVNNVKIIGINKLSQGSNINLFDVETQNKYSIKLRDSIHEVNSKLSRELEDSTCLGTVYLNGGDRNVILFGTEGDNWLLFDETTNLYNIKKESVIEYFKGCKLVI